MVQLAVPVNRFVPLFPDRSGPTQASGHLLRTPFFLPTYKDRLIKESFLPVVPLYDSCNPALGQWMDIVSGHCPVLHTEGEREREKGGTMSTESGVVLERKTGETPAPSAGRRMSPTPGGGMEKMEWPGGMGKFISPPSGLLWFVAFDKLACFLFFYFSHFSFYFTEAE